MPWAKHIVTSNWFNHSITSIIVLNAIVIGLDTSDNLSSQYGWLFEIGNYVFLTFFISEAIVKIVAEAPRPWRYFRESWNIFDFSIIVISLIPATGQLAMLARLARLLRVLRLISALPELRLIVETLVRSIPSMVNVIALMSIIFYVYAVAGFHLFNDIDPTHWRTLGISLLTLFRIVTLEDWTDIMYAAMAVEPLAWPYFVSFVILGTFVVVNLFIAVVINNLDEAKAERLADLTSPPTSKDILRELRETQAVLTRVRAKLERLERE